MRGSFLGSYEFQVGKLIDTILPQLTDDKQKQATIDALNKALGEVNNPILALQHLDNKEKLTVIMITAIGEKYPSSTNKIEDFLKNIQSSDIGLEDNHPLKTYKNPFLIISFNLRMPLIDKLLFGFNTSP